MERGQIHTFVFYLSLNDTGAGALADLERFANPGPELLSGMSAAKVAALVNFDLDESDRLQNVLGSDGVDDVITGHSWSDEIFARSGDDDISAGGSDDAVFGGAGEDQIDGGDGADALFGGDDGDLVSGGAGGDKIEGGRGDDNLLGQSGDDTLFGDAGIDTLRGGAGADSVSGGADSDTYIVTSINDKVSELAGGRGIDTVISSIITYTLGANVENLTLADAGFLKGIGNAAANVITGNTSANIIDGGLGADTMIGGLGNDIFIVRDSTDRIEEIGGLLGGRDSVRSFVTHTLAANVEDLALVGNSNVNGTGNTAINKVIGNSFNNRLNGGLGNDILTGGLGVDFFVFNTAINGAANVDHIVDFSGAGERIHLSDDVFFTLAPGGLNANFFVNGTAAIDTNDRIMYDVTTGILRYEPDGSGTSFEAFTFAVLDNHFALTSANFLIFA